MFISDVKRSTTSDKTAVLSRQFRHLKQPYLTQTQPSCLVIEQSILSSDSGADGSDFGDNDVRADRHPAAVAHRDSGLLLQEDVRGAGGSGGAQSSKGSGAVSGCWPSV